MKSFLLLRKCVVHLNFLSSQPLSARVDRCILFVRIHQSKTEGN